ncbi:MAG: GNAT family N-acetyltransferase [Alicyclobacillus sp.]|nr:GNAT family N-acetyltransferase [Alicyclobacillus sp.]
MYLLDRLTVHDVESIISLSGSVGWDYTRNEVQVFLQAGTLFGHRQDSGRIISCAGVFPYGELASIGVVIVHPQYQGRGLGRDLMQKCLREVDHVPTMLVSTVEGQRLYTSLGFKTVSSIHKLLSEKPIRWSIEPNSDGKFENLSEADLDNVIQLDTQVVGANRSKFLSSRLPFSNTDIVLRDNHGILQGYAMTVCRNDLLIVGPVVAPNYNAALTMMRLLTDGGKGRVRVDVPSSQAELFDALISLGFHEEERPPVMMRNASTLPGDRSRLYAIAAQAFG